MPEKQNWQKSKVQLPQQPKHYYIEALYIYFPLIVEFAWDQFTAYRVSQILLLSNILMQCQDWRDFQIQERGYDSTLRGMIVPCVVW